MSINTSLISWIKQFSIHRNLTVDCTEAFNSPEVWIKIESGDTYLERIYTISVSTEVTQVQHIQIDGSASAVGVLTIDTTL